MCETDPREKPGVSTRWALISYVTFLFRFFFLFYSRYVLGDGKTGESRKFTWGFLVHAFMVYLFCLKP